MIRSPDRRMALSLEGGGRLPSRRCHSRSAARALTGSLFGRAFAGARNAARRRHCPLWRRADGGRAPAAAKPGPADRFGATDLKALAIAWRTAAGSAFSRMTRVQPFWPHAPPTGSKSRGETAISNCCSSGESLSTARPSASRSVARDPAADAKVFRVEMAACRSLGKARCERPELVSCHVCPWHPGNASLDLIGPKPNQQ